MKQSAETDPRMWANDTYMSRDRCGMLVGWIEVKEKVAVNRHGTYTVLATATLIPHYVFIVLGRFELLITFHGTNSPFTA